LQANCKAVNHEAVPQLQLLTHRRGPVHLNRPVSWSVPSRVGLWSLATASLVSLPPSYQPGMSWHFAAPPAVQIQPRWCPPRGWPADNLGSAWRLGQPWL